MTVNSRNLATLAAVLAVVSPCFPATYFVAKTGSDTNSGTQTQPFLTVQKGLNSAQAGDTIRVGSGVYSQDLKTVRSGTAASPIVLDGQGMATIKRIQIEHSHHSIVNLTASGETATDRSLIDLFAGAHYTFISNCIVTPNGVADLGGIGMRSNADPALEPSYCNIVSNVIYGVLGATALTLMGNTNLFQGNLVRDIGQSDHIRLFGTRNIIRGNIFTNNYAVAGVGNHPDFIQSFGGISREHIIEGNLILHCAGGLAQMEGSLNPENRDWTFRNNVFAYIQNTASISVPGIGFYNNVFYRCNGATGNGSHALAFGSRHYTTGTIPTNGTLTIGGQYYAWSVTSSDYVTNGAQAILTSGGTYFIASATTYKRTGTAQVYTRGTNRSDRARVFNNVFLECGDGRATRGWYSIANLPGVAADYNYVANTNYMAVTLDSEHKAVGDPGGWNWDKWWEPHGINGGDPRFLNITGLHFRLQEGSPLIGAAVSFNASFTTDIRGAPRGFVWDIGAFEFQPGETVLLPDAPTGLRVVGQ